MSTESHLGPVSLYIQECLRQRLQECRVVVWYDAPRSFAALLDKRELPETTII